jgi:phosphonatase-like hydrolase
MSPRFKLAVLDIAGTTVVDKDFVAIAFVEAFQNYGIHLTVEEINPLMGFKKTEAIATVLKEKKVEVSDQKIDYIHNEFVAQMVKFYTNSPEVRPIPYAEEFFIFLKSNDIKVSLGSGFPKVIVDVILDRLEWTEKGLVDFYVASDEVVKGRPFPFMIEHLMKKSGLSDAKQVIKIGDTMVDIQEGRMANCGLVAAVTTGAYKRKELEVYAPDYIVDSLKELEQYII